ncbi:MAG TPA: hypothetical protein VIJ75_05150 [Hanamia sp.]
MACNYIYIDDTFKDIEKGTINGLENGGEIKIDFLKPNTWEELLNILMGKLQTSNGLLLDLRLGEIPFEGEKRAEYKGSTLAQELRTRIKEKKIISFDFPIVLISGDAYIKESLDKTSCDLFDAIIEKEKLGNEIQYSDFKKQLISLATGYQELNRIENIIEKVLNIGDTSFIDIRVLDAYKKIEAEPKHIIARFLLKDLLAKPSFLIDENFLSARLGVNQKSEDWSTLKNKILEHTKYTGVFSDFYIRWWMPLLEMWWQKEISDKVFLRNSSAKQRVELLSEKLKLKLIPVEKTEKSKSDCFWTVCKATLKPIDTIDGFVIANQDDLYPWQEKEYVCVDEALRPTKIDSWKGVAALEKNRLQKLKELYSKTEQRIKK